MWITWLSDISVGGKVYAPGDYVDMREKDLPHISSGSWVPGTLTKAALKKKLVARKKLKAIADEQYAGKVASALADPNRNVKEEIAEAAEASSEIDAIASGGEE